MLAAARQSLAPTIMLAGKTRLYQAHKTPVLLRGYKVYLFHPTLSKTITNVKRPHNYQLVKQLHFFHLCWLV